MPRGRVSVTGSHAETALPSLTPIRAVPAILSRIGLPEHSAHSPRSSRLLADVYFIATLSFLWKVSVITLVSCLPLYVLKYLRRRFSPPSYSKLTS